MGLKIKTLSTCLGLLCRRPIFMWFELPLMMRILECGYYERLSRFLDIDITGSRVLDIGCGSGFYGPLFLLLGASQYVGCDYKMSLSSPMSKNYCDGGLKNMGVTAEGLTRRFKEKILLFEGGLEQLPPELNYDIVVMQLVTEHLQDIKGAFETAHGFLVPGGRFLFHHHNFYCWNGHHQPPQTVSEIDQDSKEQKKYFDWNHLRYTPEPHEYVASKLNRIRLDELRSLTEQFFFIENWIEPPSGHEYGINRLTPEILASFPEYSKRELSTQSVQCVAVKKKDYHIIK